MASVLTAVDTDGQVIYNDPEGVVWKITFRWFIIRMQMVYPLYLFKEDLCRFIIALQEEQTHLWL